MTTSVRSYAVRSSRDHLAPYECLRRDPRATDVVIEILYCGVCHSDLHQVRNDWGTSVYPMVPGHEIVGRVIAVGKEVRTFSVGDHVGVGCMVDSCQSCSSCKNGLEQYCKDVPTFTYNGLDRHDHMPTYGGYSERIVVSESFVLKMPSTIDLKRAAPLLCAGITTWSPLKHWKVGPQTKLAVVGLGGLGHMALKFAKALRADTTLLTRSPGKEADARLLGAQQVVLSTNPQQMEKLHGTFDLILDTVPTSHDLNPYLPLLSTNGTMVLVGYLGALEPALNTVPLILGRKSVAGSVIGGIAETQEMLDFCGQHHIGADVEMIPIQKINEAYERMQRSDVKYRFVIDLASLKA